MQVTRCGAKTRAGYACQQPALPNGRCKWHGGKSTGPKTEAGKAQARNNGAKGGRPRKTITHAKTYPKPTQNLPKTWAENMSIKNKRLKPMGEQKHDAWLTFLAKRS